jgi:excisionase family DNA binding protein
MDSVLTDRNQRLFDIQGAVAYLQSMGATGVSVSTVRSLIASGQVAHIKLGRRFYITREAIDEWLSRHERRAR